MDFSFTEDQQELVGLARKIFSEQVTTDELRQIEAGEDHIDRRLWELLAQSGLLSASLPEALGGAGGGVVDLCLVLEEAGRRLAPVPLLPTVAMGAWPIAEFGTAEQQERWIPAVSSGHAILTAALSEPRHHARPGGARALADGSGYRLEGTFTSVPSATVADLVVVLAELDGSPTAFLVEAGTPGLTVRRQETSDGAVAGWVELDSVAVPSDALLGQPDRTTEAAPFLLQRASIAMCAFQLGVVEEALAETAQYTKERVQFDRPIATFQAVGHRCADCYIDVEAVRLTLWQAAWRLDAGMTAETEVDVAKFWAAEAGHRVAHAAVHLHGGMGVATEHSTHRYFVAAKTLEFALGGATERLLAIGQRFAEPVQ